MKSVVTKAVILGGVTLATITAAKAENTETPSVTLYGTVDVGYAQQNHGAPYSDTFGPGMEYMIQKSSNNSQSAWTNNGLSQSMIGLRGLFALDDQWSLLFRAETAFDPISMRIADHLKTMTQNNGVAVGSQTTNADSSLAGQMLNSAGFVGITSPTYGQLTFGRQSSPMRDNIIKYDPQSGSYAFSPIGFSGTAAGAGATEDARFNDALRYSNTFGKVRTSVLYANAHNQGGAAWQMSVGTDYQELSVDGVFATKKQAIAANPLGTASTTAATSISALIPGSGWHAPNTAGYSFASTTASGQFAIDKSLAATASDNTAYGLMAKYAMDKARIFGGYERIRYANPSAALSAGYRDIGGYTLAIINNGAYTTDKVLDIGWIGMKYAVTPQLDVTGAYYRYVQNSYTGNACTPPKSTATNPVNTNSACSSGTQNTWSLVADYKYNSYFDFYAGIATYNVTGGLASGFMNTSMRNVMAGGRLKF